MLKATPAEAVASLREAIATLPSEAEARSDFFVQWRMRAIELIERLFPGDPEPVRQFKELEFSPRRIGKNDSQEQLKLDAYLAGCAAARTLLESLIASVTTAAAAPAPAANTEPELQGEAQTPTVLIDATPVSEPSPASAPAPVSAPAPAIEPAAAAKPVPAAKPPPPIEPIPAIEPTPPIGPTPAAEPTFMFDLTAAPEVDERDGVISGGTMDTKELCAPVRSSLSRVLGAWDKGDRESALVLSAQLLAELTVLSRDDRFRGAFEKVVNTAFDNNASEALKAAAPKCMWSLVAAMNEVMKA
jgi:hypothetical protein